MRTPAAKPGFAPTSLSGFARSLIPGFLLLLAGLPAVPQQAAGPTPAERWREALLYGIESEVLQVIGQIKSSGDDSLNPELLQTLRGTSNPAVAAAVLELFAQGQARDAETLALEKLADPEKRDPRLLVPCMRYLAAIRCEAAAEPLIGFLDSGEELAGAAIQALAVLGQHSSGEALLNRLRAPDYPEGLKPQLLLALGSLKYQPAAEDLIAVVANPDEERTRRMYAASALGQIGDAGALPALRALLTAQDALLRTYAAAALAGFALTEVETVLQDGLRDGNARVRQAAAKALARKDAQKSVDILIYKARYDAERAVRLEAIRSLGAIGNARALSYLREAYQDRMLGNPYREEALAALLERDPDGSLGAVRAVVAEEGSRKDPAALEFTARRLAALEHGGLGELFLRFLKNPNVAIRLYGLRGIRLNHLGSLREKVRALADEDPHPSVRREAQLVLEAL
jgi:HEAT repeat protein